MTIVPCKVLDDLGWAHDFHGGHELLSHFRFLPQGKQIKVIQNHKSGELHCQPQY